MIRKCCKAVLAAEVLWLIGQEERGGTRRSEQDCEEVIKSVKESAGARRSEEEHG